MKKQIPLHPKPIVAGAPSKVAMSFNHPIKVLVIEGDHNVRSSIRLSFVASGDFDLEFCSSSEEAINTIPEFCPDVVSLDASLPTAVGQLALRSLSGLSEMRGIPIVYATNGCPQSDMESLFNLGATSVVSRPYDPFAVPGQVIREWESVCA